MTESPELDEFRRLIDGLRKHPSLGPLLRRGEIDLGKLSVAEIASLLQSQGPAYYFLLAAAQLTRTTLKSAAAEPDAAIVTKALRKAHAVKARLPRRGVFADIANAAVTLRGGDLRRKTSGGIESLFRERLAAEGIGVLMSPPLRAVPGILIARRKPDGVFPDPATGAAPEVYLEIKNVRRVADDIQKRLYEIAEASLEMKFLYGNLKLEGLGIRSTKDVVTSSALYREKLRQQITATRPVVVVLLLCRRAEAEKYKEGAEAFVDRVFFQEEIEECLAFLKAAVLAV